MKNDSRINLSGKTLIYFLISVILLAGCAARDSKYESLYSALTEESVVTAGRPLEGRRIVIDPGHGGRFKGIVGIDSLSESEVNLGVALYLWGMLEEEGAEVHLTRTTDRDFAKNEASELKSDLAARMEKANSFDPEVFISIHHNSSLPLNRDRNRIEIFYNSEDNGASLELAKYARLHLARNLGIEESIIMPGNFHVLRNSKGGASILGEASYLSHPVVEDRLKLASKQKLEAEAYMLALMDYFSRGVPSLNMVFPESDTLNAPAEIVYQVRKGFEVPLDPSSARIFIDGEEKIPVLEGVGETIHYGLAEEASNKVHQIKAAISSVKGASASSAISKLTLSRPPEHFIPLPPAGQSGGSTTLPIKILDKHGNSVIDGMEVTVSPLESDVCYKETSLGGVSYFQVDHRILPGYFRVEAEGVVDTVRFEIDPSPLKVLARVVNEKDETPIPFPVLYQSGVELVKGDSKGVIRLDRSLSSSGFIFMAGGFRPSRELMEFYPGDSIPGSVPTIALKPLFEGVIINKRIVINPGGGGSEHGVVGKSLIREASINLDVARKIRDLLVYAGAEVTLTRMGEETISVQERVSRANRFDPDLAMGIHHDILSDMNGCELTILHYPGSEGGIRISSLLQTALDGIYPEIELLTEESANHFLTHTSCPACELHLGSPLHESLDGIVSDPDYKHFAAERIFASILAYFKNSSLEITPVTISVVRGSEPISGAVVTVDNILTLPTGRTGEVLFNCIEPGEHLISIHKGGEHYYSDIHDFRPESQPVITIDLGSAR